MLAVAAFVTVDAVDFIQTDSDFGELFLVKNWTGEWSVLYIDRGLYFKRDSGRTFCTTFHDYYNQCSEFTEFSPTTLNILLYSETTFPSGLFSDWYFQRLQNFEMSNFGMTEFQSIGLLGANSLKLLNLTSNMLTEMPSRAFSGARNLATIDLSHNQISKMEWDVFRIEFTESATIADVLTGEDGLEKLEIIRLNHNKLAFIDPNWFSGLLKLSTLTLNENALTAIDYCVLFNTNIALKVLHLQNNALSVINDGCELQLLDTFDISNNPSNNGTQMIQINAASIDISNVNAHKCFVPPDALIVRASHNQIDTIIVTGASENALQEIYLNHNKVNSSDFLFELTHLRIIDLSHNELAEVNGTVFENMPHLTTLNIAHNKLASIDLAFLKSMGQLANLDVSSNSLSGSFHLDGKAIALSVLNISNNHYTSIKHNLKREIPSLTQIDINGNDFECDDLLLMVLFLNSDHITLVIRNNVDFDGTNNVKGIQCVRARERGVADLTKTTVKKAKEQIIQSFDERLVKLETKLICLINNVTAAKVTDNTIEEGRK